MIYKTLVFDFDGTIADTLGELLDHLDIPKRRVPTLIARGTGMMRGNITQLQLIDGMSEVLIELRRHVRSFGILTSNATANVDLFLRTHGLRDQFDFISSTSKLTGKSKHLRAIRKTFSLRPEELLYIGDELRDVKASQKAGIPIAAVTWGFNSRESLAASEPDYLFDKPEDFLRLLA